MFKNMLRTKTQREEDQVKFNERMFPLGEQQKELTQEMVVRISKKYTDDPMIFYYYLSAADNYYKERMGELKKTLLYLNKVRPKLSAQGIAELIGLMELTIGLKSLEDFPTENAIMLFSKNNINNY